MSHCQCPSETEATTAEVRTVRPRTHTREDESGTTLSIALPGVSKENLKLNLLESRIQLEADRPGAAPLRYALNLRLGPRVDGQLATAALDAGVLKLTLPLREAAKPRPIAVD